MLSWRLTEQRFRVSNGLPDASNFMNFEGTKYFDKGIKNQNLNG